MNDKNRPIRKLCLRLLWVVCSLLANPPFIDVLNRHWNGITTLKYVVLFHQRPRGWSN